MTAQRAPISRRAHLALLGGAVGSLAGCLGGPNPGTGEQASAAGDQTPGEEPAATGDPPSFPDALADNCVGFLTYDPREAGKVAEVGGGWCRPHPGPFVWGDIEPEPGSYDFRRADEYVAAAGRAGVAVLATVFPYAAWDQPDDAACRVDGSDIFARELPAARCAPTDLDAYSRFLRTLVERYNGIGEHAMPGLELPVRHWEVLNEPSLRAPDLTFFRGEAAEYRELLEASYAAIKGACPDCTVLNGGVASVHDGTFDFWRDVLADGGGDHVDVANIHFIGRGHDESLNVEPFARLLGEHGIEAPIWVTEVEFEREDAPVVAMTDGAMAAGAEKVFYVSFAVGGIEPTGPGEYDRRYAEVADRCGA